MVKPIMDNLDTERHKTCTIAACDNLILTASGDLCQGHRRLRHKVSTSEAREDGDAQIQGYCVMEGCLRTQESKGIVNGQRRYDKLCSAHRAVMRGRRVAPIQYHRQPAADPTLLIPCWVKKKDWLASLNMSECVICGWEGPCDKHRIKHGKDGGKYHRGNVMILCPNCHRLLHTGKLKLK